MNRILDNDPMSAFKSHKCSYETEIPDVKQDAVKPPDSYHRSIHHEETIGLSVQPC